MHLDASCSAEQHGARHERQWQVQSSSRGGGATPRASHAVAGEGGAGQGVCGVAVGADDAAVAVAGVAALGLGEVAAGRQAEGGGAVGAGKRRHVEVWRGGEAI